jgi:hypothetical protein
MKRYFLLSLIVLVIASAFSAPAAGMQPKEYSAAGCVDTPKDKKFPRFARLMHDYQWMEWPSRMQDPEWHSGFHLDWYPQTVQLWPKPKGGDGKIPYSRDWLEYLRDLQPNDSGAVWLARISAGLFNRGQADIPILNLDQLQGQAVAQNISAGGNVVRILQVRNGSGLVETLFYKKAAPSASAVNYQKTPWLVSKFTSISIDGEIGNAGGIDVYFPLLSKDKAGSWVDMDRVEYFPRLPVCVTVKSERNVLAGAGFGSRVVGTLSKGAIVAVLEYMPQGSNVWGRTSQGWILLEYLVDGVPVYPTSWTMETRPPILFD